MRRHSLAKLVVTLLLSVFLCSIVRADALTGPADVTVVDGAIVSIAHGGREYVVAVDDLVLGTTRG
jgi:hypothetical protein